MWRGGCSFALSIPEAAGLGQEVADRGWFPAAVQLLATHLLTQAAPAAGWVACHYATWPDAADRCQDQCKSIIQTLKLTKNMFTLLPGPGFMLVFAVPAHYFSRILMKTFLDRDECHRHFN